MEARKVPDELKAAFDEIALNQLALQMKVDAFQYSINKDVHHMAVTAKATWDEAKAVLGLKGEWQYKDGMVYLIVAEPNV